MKTLLFTNRILKLWILFVALIGLVSTARADSVVATSVVRGNTVTTTTARGVYTTEIRRAPSGTTSETRFESNASRSGANRNEYRPMTH